MGYFNDDLRPAPPFSPPRQIGLARAPREIIPVDRGPLAEIAGLVRRLTYGEMIELADTIMDEARTEPGGITADNLARVLHRWSTR